VLQARLVGGERPLVLRTELDWRGRPVAMEVEEREDDDAATATKVFARYLTAYLEALDERLAAGRAVA
jgi:hypothetical protein